MSSVDFPAVYANWQAGGTPRNRHERKAVDVSVHIKYTDGQKAALVASSDYTGERITVARGPGLAPITVPVRRLAGWHVATRFASGRYLFPRPMIAAYMICTDIPEETREAFGHLCKHGPGPHLIRVAILPRGARLRAETLLLRLSRWVYAVKGNPYSASRRLRQRAERHAATGSAVPAGTTGRP